MGTESAERAKAQIDETWKLLVERVQFEIVEKLVVLERALSVERSPFDLLAHVNHFQGKLGVVMMSAWWLAELADPTAELNTITERFRGMVDSDLFGAAARFCFLPPEDDWVKRFHEMAKWGGAFEHSPRSIFKGNIAVDRVLPDGFVITNCKRKKPETVPAAGPEYDRCGGEKILQPPGRSANLT